MSLRQNAKKTKTSRNRLSYQSECHCAKTTKRCFENVLLLSYQSECHCAKTVLSWRTRGALLSYQSECHCAKTTVLAWV